MSLKKNKALLIVNPRAGKQTAKNHLFTIISILSQKYDLTVHLTEYAGDATDTAAEANEFDTIICCGGDGTFSQVLDGVAKLNHPVNIGYIPCGTTNDLATATDIPKKISSAAQAIVDGTPIPHDVGLFGDSRRFIYTATFGAFARTSFNTPQDMKNLFGHFAYLLSGIGELGSIRDYKVKIQYDGRVRQVDDLLLCAVLNTTSFGGVLKIPQAEVDFDDGFFEVLLVRRPTDIFRLNAMILDLTSSNFSTPEISLLKASSLRIETEDPVAWTIDGENAGEHRAVNIRCMRKATKIIRVPSEDAKRLTAEESKRPTVPSGVDPTVVRAAKPTAPTRAELPANVETEKVIATARFDLSPTAAFPKGSKTAAKVETTLSGGPKAASEVQSTLSGGSKTAAEAIAPISDPAAPPSAEPN